MKNIRFMLIYKMKMIQLQLRKLMLANMALLRASITFSVHSAERMISFRK